MVTLLLDRTQLEVVLSPVERAAAFHRDNIRIARDTIRKVQLTDDAWTWLRGVPNPGTHLPGVLAAGTWKSGQGAEFVLIRRKRPSVIIDLDGDPLYRRLVLSTKHGLALTQALRLPLDATPTDVIDLIADPESEPAPKRPVIRPRPA